MATAKTETLKATEINAATGEVIVRDLTNDELAQREIDQAEFTAQKEIETAKAQTRASALAKLAAIGLTQEEIDSL
jgi:hypothetical protein